MCLLGMSSSNEGDKGENDAILLNTQENKDPVSKDSSKSKIEVTILETTFIDDSRTAEESSDTKEEIPEEEVICSPRFPSSSAPLTTYSSSSPDLSQLLPLRSFSHSVEVQVNWVRWVCSGALLSLHSPVLHVLLAQGASVITLKELACPPGEEDTVEDALRLLYGDTISITDRNVAVIVRFSVHYSVPNMYRLALAWASAHVSAENVYGLWEVGRESAVRALPKRKKKRDLVEVSRRFVRGREVEVAASLGKRGQRASEEFVRMLLQYTDCAATITELLS